MIAQIPPYTWEYGGEGGEFLYDKNYNTVNTEYIIKRGYPQKSHQFCEHSIDCADSTGCLKKRVRMCQGVPKKGG